MPSNVAYFLWALVALCASLPAHALLPIQNWQTAHGARVYFVQSRELPIVDVSVDFPAGSAFDTREKSGAAALTQRLLKLGAGGLGEDEIARRIADIGAQLGGRFETDRAGVSLRTLSSSDELRQSLDVLARVLQQPEFPASVLEREKARSIAAVKEADTRPETILGRNFNNLVYGSHPYGLRSSGEAATLAVLTREDLLQFYRRYYTADQAIVAIIGDLSRADAERIAERLTAALPRSTGKPTITEVPPLARAEVRAIPHPASQSHVIVGMPGITRDDPDYFPLFVGNYVLGGGGFVSRITEEVRSKRGLAYAAYSYFSPLKQKGPFAIGLQTRKDQAGEALAVVRNTLKEFVARGPTASELRAAKQNLIGGFPLRIDSNRKILEYLGVIGFYQLPLDYLDTFVANIEKVTIADIRAAFGRHVDPDRMVTVVVGVDEAALGAASTR